MLVSRVKGSGCQAGTGGGFRHIAVTIHDTVPAKRKKDVLALLSWKNIFPLLFFNRLFIVYPRLT